MLGGIGGRRRRGRQRMRWLDGITDSMDVPFQFSYLENPMDRGAWEQATVHGLTKSQTQLKQLSSHTQMLRGLGRLSDLLHVAWGDRV